MCVFAKSVFIDLMLYHFITNFSQCAVIVRDQISVASSLHKFLHRRDISNERQYFTHNIFVYLT